MLAVMLILLLATAAAAVSVQATTFEMKAAGNNRRVMQSKLVAEAGLALTMSRIDALGAAVLEKSFKRLEELGTAETIPDGADFGEPNCAPPDDRCDRFSHHASGPTATDFKEPVFTTDPFPSEMLGPRQPYQPWFAVDLRYEEDDPKPIPGYRAEGGGSMKFLHVNLIARGGAVFDQADSVRSARTVHTSCASMMLGPVMSY